MIVSAINYVYYSNKLQNDKNLSSDNITNIKTKKRKCFDDIFEYFMAGHHLVHKMRSSTRYNQKIYKKVKHYFSQNIIIRKTITSLANEAMRAFVDKVYDFRMTAAKTNKVMDNSAVYTRPNQYSPEIGEQIVDMFINRNCKLSITHYNFARYVLGSLFYMVVGDMYAVMRIFKRFYR